MSQQGLCSSLLISKCVYMYVCEDMISYGKYPKQFVNKALKNLMYVQVLVCYIAFHYVAFTFVIRLLGELPTYMHTMIDI